MGSMLLSAPDQVVVLLHEISVVLFEFIELVNDDGDVTDGLSVLVKVPT